MKSPFLALVRNDLCLFFADKRALVAILCVPVGIASFSVAARASVGAGKTAVALIIPKGFGADSAQALFSPAAPRPKLTFLYDPAKSSELQMTQGLITQQVMQVVSQEAFRNPERSGVGGALQSVQADATRDPQEKAALVALLESVQRYSKTNKSGGSGPVAGGLSNPCELVKEAVTAKTDDSDKSGGKAGVSHVFVGMAVQGLLFFAVDFGIGMVRDRRAGLWKRLRAAPLSRQALLGSRLTSSASASLWWELWRR